MTRTRHVGPLLNLLVAAVVMGVIIPLALLSNQAPPPAIAEFAPQAQAQQQRSQQSSEFGNANGDELGQGAVGLPTASPTPTASPKPIDEAKAKNCIGQLQTPDPQSPPCIPYWAGDNGGATAPGVSAQYVNIAIGQVPGDQQEIDDLLRYFNTNFELYDRKLRIVSGPPSLFAATDPGSQQKDADQVAQGTGTGPPFISGSFSAFGSQHYYYDELAGHGVLGVDQNPSLTTEDHWSGAAPYEWATPAGYDKQERYLGAFICETLAGKAPKLAPPQPSPQFPSGPQQRRFALIYGRSESGAGDTPDVSILEQQMESCGATPVYTDEMSGPGPSANFQQQSTQAMTGIVSSSATTVICLCSGDYLLYGLFPAADSQHKYPEWVGSSYGDLDRPDTQLGYPSDQMSHFFGVTWRNKQLPLANEWWYQAIKSVDPGYQYCDQCSAEMRQTYQDLLTIATGIQEAGPNLTPASFQTGLFRTQFPDPGAGRAPYYQASIGFGPGDHSEYQDVALFYFDPAGKADDNSKQTGIDCYVANGRRYTPGNFPTTDAGFFNPPTC